MNCLAALGEHYHQEAAPARLAEQHEALLTLRMPRVIGDSAERITEYVAASSNVTRCLARLAAAFGPYHSNLGGSVNCLGSWLLNAHNVRASAAALSFRRRRRLQAPVSRL
jgi:hypothetical protein